MRGALFTLSLLLFITLGCSPGEMKFKIRDADESESNPPGVTPLSLSFSSGRSVEEGNQLQITASLNRAASTSVEFSFQTENNETLEVLERAEAVQDYLQSYGTISFAPGETQKTIAIPTYVDALYTKTKKFNLKLNRAQNITLPVTEMELSISERDTSIFGADVNRIYVTAGPAYAPLYIFPVPSRTLYVDQVSGSDGNSGTSEGSALATINAASAMANPGTTILVKEGIYEEQVVVVSSGTDDEPIIFKAFPGHAPIVTGAEELTGVNLVNDPPMESADIFATGFEEGTLDSTLTATSPFGRTAVGIETSADAAHGNRFLAFTFPSADSTDNGVTISKSFPSPYLDKFYFRGYVALAPGLAQVAGGTRLFLANFEGPNSGGTNTRFFKLYLRKVSGQDQYYFTVLDKDNVTMYSSQPESLFLTPGGGYLSVEFGLDNSDTVNPLKFFINGVAKTLTGQANLTNCLVRNVRFGVLHDASGIILSNTSKVMYDSIKISGSYNGDFNPVWPPTTAHSENFETNFGTLVESEHDGNIVNNSSSRARFGTQSGLMEFAGTSGRIGLTHSFSGKDDVYVRFFVNLQDFDLAHSNSSSSNNDRRWNLVTLSEGAAPRFKLALTKTSQGMKLDGEVLTPSVANISYLYKGYPLEIKNNQWHQIEMRFKGGSSDGGAEIWLDGVSVAGNYDRVPNPDVYYGLDTRGMKIDTVTFGELTTGQPYSSTTYPVANSKVYIDDYRLNTGAPSGLIPNSDPLRLYKASFNPALYAGMGTSRPAVMIMSDTIHPEGKLLKNAENKYVLSSGSFTVEGTDIYLRPHNDDPLTSQTIEFGVRDVGFLVHDKSHVVIEGFNVRATNHGNKGGIYLESGSQNISIIDNLLQANAGAGVRMEGELSPDELTVVKPGLNNKILANHFRDNILAFGSGIRMDDSTGTLIEHNLFESDTGTNISAECIDQSTCRNYSIRRNRFNSAGESHIYLAVYTHDSQVYGNWLSGARSSSYHTMKLGVRGSSGGSGVHIARGSHDNQVFNNLMYDLDTGGVSLRAKVYNNVAYNNTILRVGAKGVGTGIDFQKDGNEMGLGDNNSNGVPDGQEDTENNTIFNNIIGMTPGINRCIDIEGYAVTPTVGVSPVDTTNKSDFNRFYQCGRLALFGGQSYTPAQIATYVANTLGQSGLQRDANSSVLATDPFVDSINENYILATPITGACKIGINCPSF